MVGGVGGGVYVYECEVEGEAYGKGGEGVSLLRMAPRAMAHFALP